MGGRSRGATPGGPGTPGPGDSGGGDSSAGAARRGGGGEKTSAQALLSKLGSSRINNIFTHLRKIAQHPLLVRNNYTDAQVQEMAKIAAANNLFGGQCTVPRVTQEFMGYSDYQLHTFCTINYGFLGAYRLDPGCLLTSGKLQELDRLLRELKERGSRPLIFSQWTSVLDVMEWFLHERGMAFYRLDGSTNVTDRLSICDSFNAPDSPAFAFLLSTRAGGQGLNLTGADTVILHDVDFNPQVDRQAEDRCHRLGQTRKVTVYRLVCDNTVDADIYAIQQRKLRLDAAVLEGVTISTEPEATGGRRAPHGVDPGGAARG
ncbi:MAG: P-loop containing nucleoside triphosphate hydrolase protein [Monoraphidium minutum]|nr:MAG: P-loop containing nucleoside triphosphate hydrolase protein [Monoraphidium minutum]